MTPPFAVFQPKEGRPPRSSHSPEFTLNLPGHIVSRSFYQDKPELVGPRILGKILVHRTTAGVLSGRIVEVEAYLGPHNEPLDAAAHSHRGPTPRNLVLFGPPGIAYVYAIYGRYFCMNVSCETEGQAGCLLLRALEPLTGLERMARNRNLPWQGTLTDRVARQFTSGPSRLCQALEIVRSSHNGLDLADPASDFQIRDDGYTISEALVTPRIGINPANPALDWPLRYAIPGHPCVSGPKSLTGHRISIR